MKIDNYRALAARRAERVDKEDAPFYHLEELMKKYPLVLDYTVSYSEDAGFLVTFAKDTHAEDDLRAVIGVGDTIAEAMGEFTDGMSLRKLIQGDTVVDFTDVEVTL